MAAAQLCSSLANLTRVGVNLPEAMVITADVIGNREIRRRVRLAHQRVLQGHSLAESLEQHDFLPAIVGRMIHLGEMTGTLDESLERAVEIFNREVPRQVKRVIGFVEPASIIIGGLAVGFMVLAALMPVFKLMGALRR